MCAQVHGHGLGLFKYIQISDAINLHDDMSVLGLVDTNICIHIGIDILL